MMRLRRSAPWLLTVSLALTGPACPNPYSGDHGAAAAPSPEVESSIAEFYRIARAELGRGGDGSDARFYLRQLADHEELEVARAIVADDDPTIAFFAIPTLVESGHEDEAVPAVVAMVVNGYDVAPLYYYLIHLDDEMPGGRLILQVSRRLLADLESYEGDTRRHVEAFLVEPPAPFSVAEAERRIARMEEKLRER